MILSWALLCFHAEPEYRVPIWLFYMKTTNTVLWISGVLAQATNVGSSLSWPSLELFGDTSQR